MSSRVKDAPSASKSITHADIAMTVVFKNYALPVLVLDEHCTNSECKCRDVTLGFYEVNNQNKGHILFKIKLDIDTWEMKSSEAYEDGIDCIGLIVEFMKDLKDESKKLIKSRFENGVVFREDYVKENIDYSKLRIGSCVYYSDVFTSEEYNQLTFQYQGMSYLVLDIYCSNPKCNCNDVLLDFFELEDNAIEESSKIELRLQLKTGKYTVEYKGYDIANEKIAKLYKLFLNIFKSKGIEVLKERDTRLKKWGKIIPRYITEESEQQNSDELVSRKIGRNEFCPCGSGKKYKKCCGQ
jgi:hypothetical protein